MKGSSTNVTPRPIDGSGERKDSTSSWATSEDFGKQATVENLKAMLLQEGQAYLPCQDYLSTITAAHLPDGSDCVSEAWRRKLCEWCFEVVDHFNFDREVVSYAVSYLDRAVACKAALTSEPLPKRQFQLFAVTSLYLSIKLHGEVDERDSPRRKLRIGAFVELSRGFFQEDLIEQSEREILNFLNWRVNPPTSLRFIASLLRLCPKWTHSELPTAYSMVMSGIHDVARYLTELALCISSFSFTCKTSVLAYAAVLCAIDALQPTMPLPYAVRVAFLNNILEATGLHPSAQEVRIVCEKLKQICSSFFPNEQVSTECDQSYHENLSASVEHTSADIGVNGKSSPVCVSETSEFETAETHSGDNDSPRTHRKRGRSAVAPDENKRPLHRSNF